MNGKLFSTLFIFVTALSFNSCNGTHNPIFDCKDLNCSNVGGNGGLTGETGEKNLSFIEVLEQGYWYSRYNLSSLVMKSGNGETFMPNPEMMKQMVKMVSDDKSTATPPSNPALIKRIYNTGNPAFINKSNGQLRDFSNFRWANNKTQKTTTSAFGWTLMKEVEWSKLFNVDAHFGIPGKNDVPAANQRLGGLALCVESIIQADDFIKDFNGGQSLYDYSDNDGMFVTFAAISNLADYLNTIKQLPSMSTNRCAKIASMMKKKSSTEVAKDYMNFLYDFDLELPEATTIKQHSLLIQAYSFYSRALKDRSAFIESATDSMNTLIEAKASDVVEQAYLIRGLVDSYRITKEKKYLTSVISNWNIFYKKFDLNKGYFTSKTDYKVDDVAVIISALNSMKLYLGKNVSQRNVLITFINFFNTIINKAQLQISAPPIESISKWERKANSDFHRFKELPLPKNSGGKYGIAPVFATSVTINNNVWSNNTKSFNTAGAMHLANQMIWFHNGEVTGFPCPDSSCVEAFDIDPDDLKAPSKPNPGNGGKKPVPTLTFNTIHKTILTRCIGCHAGSGAPHGLDMSTPDRAYQNLVRVSSVEGDAFGGVLRIMPGNSSPTKSYIIAKLRKLKNLRIGARMPRGGPYLSDEEIQSVKDWIDNGAKR